MASARWASGMDFRCLTMASRRSTLLSALRVSVFRVILCIWWAVVVGVGRVYLCELLSSVLFEFGPLLLALNPQIDLGPELGGFLSGVGRYLLVCCLH